MNQEDIQEPFCPSCVPLGSSWEQTADILAMDAVRYIFSRKIERAGIAEGFAAGVETKALAEFREKFGPNQKFVPEFLNEHDQEIRNILHAAVRSEDAGKLTSDEWIRLLCYALPVYHPPAQEKQVQPDRKIIGKLVRLIIAHVFPKAENKQEAERFYNWLAADIYERLGQTLLPLSQNAQDSDHKRYSQAIRYALGLARDSLHAMFDRKDLSLDVREDLRKRIADACSQFEQEFGVDNEQADPTRESISWAEKQSEEIAKQFARSLVVNLCGMDTGCEGAEMIDVEAEKRLFIRIKKYLRGSILDAAENPQLYNDDPALPYEAALRALQEEDVGAINDPVAWIRHAFTAAGLQYSVHVARSKKSQTERETICAVSDIAEDLFKIFSTAFFPEANADEMKEFTKWLSTANGEILVETVRHCKDIKNGKEFEERFYQTLGNKKFFGMFQAAFYHEDLNPSVARNIKERERKGLTRMLREGAALITESEAKAKP